MASNDGREVPLQGGGVRPLSFSVDSQGGSSIEGDNGMRGTTSAFGSEYHNLNTQRDHMRSHEEDEDDRDDDTEDDERRGTSVRERDETNERTPFASSVKLPPKNKGVTDVPLCLDRTFRRLDDGAIKCLQAPLMSTNRCCLHLAKVFELCSLFVTFLTCVEIAIILPIMLYLVHQDHLGNLYTITMLVLSTATQLPKRFLWRPRPWIVGRAIKLRKDQTSSFPSRAVTCGAVYGLMIAEAVDFREYRWQLAVACGVTFALMASCARVYLGVHYISDCIFGLLMGSLVCTVSILLFEGQQQICGSCYATECYAEDATTAFSWSTLNNLNPFVASTAFVASLALVFVFAVPPILFWVKAAHVYGILFPCLVFHFALLCPRLNNGFSLAPPPVARAEHVVLALAMAALCLGAGKIKKGGWMRSVLVYTVLFLITLSVLTAWRLR